VHAMIMKIDSIGRMDKRKDMQGMLTMLMHKKKLSIKQ
jgi:hypothetical protein